jgi:WXG100 family type VII secretion target
MAGQIRITPEQMRSRATEYRAQATNVEDVINAMDNLLNALQSEWEGESSAAFADRFTELRPGFVSAKELIDEIAAALDATANDIEDLDSQIAGQFRG